MYDSDVSPASFLSFFFQSKKKIANSMQCVHCTLYSIGYCIIKQNSMELNCYRVELQR